MSDFKGMYDIRAASPDDINFIMATWLRGLYYGDSWFSMIPKNIFMDNYKKIAVTTMAHPKVIVKVACLKEDPTVILGYSIVSSDEQAIVWCFVKSAWRRQGIGRSLLPQSPKFVTHLTALGKSLMVKFPTAVFNPFFGGV
jgi:hypothetical protein